MFWGKMPEKRGKKNHPVIIWKSPAGEIRIAGVITKDHQLCL
jgi:hypothetical protein